jgi:PTH1 family peptidyl-tRNA hydrolase
MVADLLAERLGARFGRGKFRTVTVEGRLAGLPVVIVKPSVFMNESGGRPSPRRLPSGPARQDRGRA